MKKQSFSLLVESIRNNNIDSLLQLLVNAKIRDWDVERSKDTLRAVILQRNRELVDFINRDFAIAKVAQGLAQKKLLELNEQESLDALEYRQVMMGYREAREFLKELIGIFEGQTDILNRVGA